MYSLYELVPVCGIVIFDDVFQNAQELRPFEVKAFWNCFKKDYNLSDAYFSRNSAVGVAFFSTKPHRMATVASFSTRRTSA